jgi:hypothetical protein
MSAIAQAQRNKNADLRRRSPTGHHDARTNQQAVHQTYPRSLHRIGRRGLRGCLTVTKSTRLRTPATRQSGAG